MQSLSFLTVTYYQVKINLFHFHCFFLYQVHGASNVPLGKWKYMVRIERILRRGSERTRETPWFQNNSAVSESLGFQPVAFLCSDFLEICNIISVFSQNYEFYLVLVRSNVEAPPGSEREILSSSTSKSPFRSTDNLI